jgi:tetrahydromethanopterin S-methyltransferase subunit G
MRRIANSVPEIEMTAAEIKEIEQRIAKDKKRFDAAQNEVEKSANAKSALLEKLGITAEEAVLLLS